MRFSGRSLPPLATLRPFEAAARHESFKAAAEELHLSQAAISRQIRALEADVGVVLFERRHRQVVLTSAGRGLALAIGRGLAEIGNAADTLRARRGENEVTVLIELYVAMYWLVPLLPNFHAQHPDISIQVSATTEPLTRAGGQFDLAVQSSDRPAGGLEPLFTAFGDIFPVCAPSFAARDSLTLTALAEQPLLHFREPPGDQWLDWQDWFRRLGVDKPLREPAQMFDSYPVMVQAAVAGQGVILGWGRGLTALLEAGQLVRPVPDTLRQSAGLSVYATTSAFNNAATDVVAQWLRERLDEPIGGP
jgi:DNA-binding transcriptional LysR family regulator